jgi:hypothetical protein
MDIWKNEMTLKIYYAPSMKINLKYIKDLNVTIKIIKLLEHKGEKFCNIKISYEQKKWSIKKKLRLNSIKIKNLYFSFF